MTANKEKSYEFIQSLSPNLSYADYAQSWRRTYLSFESEAAKAGTEFQLPEFCRQYCREHLKLEISPEQSENFADLVSSEWNQGTVFVDGLRDFLKRLRRRYRLSILTNTPYPMLVHNNLAAMECSGFFDRVVTSAELGTRKPSPEAFKHMLESLDIPPQKAVHVGDDYQCDYLGATRFGITAYLIDKNDQYPNVPRRLKHIFEIDRVLRSPEQQGLIKEERSLWG